jgi:hypothetical protein
MKMQLKSILLFMGLTFIIFTGFKNPDVRGLQALQVNAPPSPVTISSTFTGGTFPSFTGTFTTSGALETSGTVTMVVDLNSNGARVHCSYLFVSSDGTGTITVKEQCQFITSPWKGRWEIVSGTGAYANLKGNGSSLFPPGYEFFVGVIY